MAGIRKQRTQLARRRSLDDEDTRSAITGAADDSQSDLSVPSDVDEHADADNSDLSEAGTSRAKTDGKENVKRKVNGVRDVKIRSDAASQRRPSPPIARSDAVFTAPKDTDMMLNGFDRTDHTAEVTEVDFETGHAVEAASETLTAAARQETFLERKRREHDEYKKKRDSDPAFIPNRGAFFMHDQRHGQAGFRPFVGRGGRGNVGGPFPAASLRRPAPEATQSPWQHDLHEVVNTGHAHPNQRQSIPPNTPGAKAMPAQYVERSSAAHTSKPPPVRTFSTTVHTHNATVRVFLPNMKAPSQFQNVPIRQHTRLPNHRPPLRRDKPVRISLPPRLPRYIFPTVERSFIFIPRALRPNQQGFNRGRGRAFGSFGGGYSSRRTSAYGGSVYSPSLAMSRRSSMAREAGREGVVSPTGSIMSRPGGFQDPSRPVVRLPPGGQKQSDPALGTSAPTTPLNMAPPSNYPLPQKPAFRENWQGQIPMHQPRPQKAVSVAGIESPASLTFNPPQQQEQQPFHQQIPVHAGAVAQATEPPPYYPHSRQPSFPSQVTTGTPLSNIPERAIHAPAFQPFQPGLPPQAFAAPQAYYYPPGTQTQFIAPAGMVPMFVPAPAPGGYMMPMAAAPSAPATAAPAVISQPGPVAYESNGMTYYVDPGQLYPAQQQPVQPSDGYSQAPASYAVPGMGGMMTPGPDGAYYYPQGMAGAAFYPPQ